MRKRLLTVVTLVALCSLLAAPGPIGRIADSASGRGSIRFGEGEQGRGYFEFDVESGSTGPSGKFLFAAEEPHAYPDVVIRIYNIIRVDIEGSLVRIRGEGHLHLTPVLVEVVAIDNVGTGELDDFSVETTPLNGEPSDGNFFASGKVVQGYIHVGALD